MPEISVIVTTYNRKQFLAETVNAILNQTYTDFELIVVDNFSNYNFFEHIESFNDNRIIAFQNQNNGIIAVNRNFGIKKAQGTHIAFCDDDDVWFPDKLERQFNLLLRSDYDLIYSDTQLVFENGLNKLTNYRTIDSINKLLRGNQISLSSVLLKKGASVYFSESKDLIALEDYDLWIRLMEAGYKFGMIKEPLLNYRVIKSSVSRHSRKKIEMRTFTFLKGLLKRKKYPWIVKLIITFAYSIRYLRFVAFSIINT